MTDSWRYEIKYGPDGEADYAWLYRGDEMVATMKTHHAIDVVSAVLKAKAEDGAEQPVRPIRSV